METDIPLTELGEDFKRGVRFCKCVFRTKAGENGWGGQVGLTSQSWEGHLASALDARFSKRDGKMPSVTQEASHEVLFGPSARTVGGVEEKGSHILGWGGGAL